MRCDIVYSALSEPIARPVWQKGLAQKLWDRQNGICPHCNSQLPPRDEHPRKYDIDHHPIPFKDIADNACPRFCIQIHDPCDINNLVTTHISCNRSHKYEKTQWFCSKRKSCWAVWLTSMFVIGVGAGCIICIIL